MPSNFGSTITIINNSGCELKVDNDPLAFGAWSSKPTHTIANDTNDRIVAFPDQMHTCGSEGSVTYTVQNNSKDKLTLNFTCNNKKKNICTLKSGSPNFKITYDKNAENIAIVNPLDVVITVAQSD